MSTPFWWWNLTKEQKAKRVAWSLVLTPTILLFPITFLPFADPWVLVEHWDVYSLFYALPFAVAAACWIYARRLRAESGKEARSQSWRG